MGYLYTYIYHISRARPDFWTINNSYTWLEPLCFQDSFGNDVTVDWAKPGSRGGQFRNSDLVQNDEQKELRIFSFADASYSYHFLKRQIYFTRKKMDSTDVFFFFFFFFSDVFFLRSDSPCTWIIWMGFFFRESDCFVTWLAHSKWLPGWLVDENEAQCGVDQSQKQHESKKSQRRWPLEIGTKLALTECCWMLLGCWAICEKVNGLDGWTFLYRPKVRLEFLFE